MKEAILKVDSLTKIYPHPSREKVNVPLFADTSFEMSSDSVNFVIGPSGSGKSTLLKIIMAVESFQAGEIHVKEQMINNLQGKAKQRYLSSIGYMDQFPSKYLFMAEKVKHNLHYNLKLYKKSIKRQERIKLISEISKQLDFSDKLDSRLAILSGGELRRVSFACSIISKPDILLCDEPTAHLDSLTKQSLVDSVMKVAKEYDTLIIIATHDKTHLSEGTVFEITNRRIQHVPC